MGNNASVSAGVVIKREDPNSTIYEQTLYVVRPDGLVGIPAGHLKGGETPVQCAIREFLEETGHEVSLVGLQRIVTLVDPNTGITSIGFIFRGELGKKVSEGEHEIRWVSAQETIELLDQTFLPKFHIAAVWDVPIPGSMDLIFEKSMSR